MEVKEFEPLSSERVLLRTILDSSWVRNGEPHYIAFIPKKNDVGGKLSLFFEKTEAGKRFKDPIYGFLDVNIGIVRTVKNGEENLEVIQDEDSHASIIGIPNFLAMPKTTPEEKNARKAADKLAKNLASEIIEKKAATINEYIEEGFSPKDLLK